MSRKIRTTLATAFVALSLGGVIAACVPARADDFRAIAMSDGGSVRDGGGEDGGLLDGFGAAFLGGLVDDISTAYIEDSAAHNRESCFRIGNCHSHVYEDGAGTKTAEIVKPPKKKLH